MEPLSVNVPLSLLHESHMGTMRSPITSELMTCAPSVGVLEQSFTEHTAGHVFFANLIQWSFHVPHLHPRAAVPSLFFQPVAGMLIFLSYACNAILEEITDLADHSINIF